MPLLTDEAEDLFTGESDAIDEDVIRGFYDDPMPGMSKPQRRCEKCGEPEAYWIEENMYNPPFITYTAVCVYCGHLGKSSHSFQIVRDWTKENPHPAETE